MTRYGGGRGEAGLGLSATAAPLWPEMAAGAEVLRAGAAGGRMGYTGEVGGEAGGSSESELARGWERLRGRVSEVSSSLAA